MGRAETLERFGAVIAAMSKIVAPRHIFREINEDLPALHETYRAGKRCEPVSYHPINKL
jgi:hypothetical protein